MGRGETRPYHIQFGTDDFHVVPNWAWTSGAINQCQNWATGAVRLRRGVGVAFCSWTGFGLRSMYVFMVSVFLSSDVTDVSPTTCGPALFTRCNPRLLRRADTAFAFIASHTV